MKKFLVFLLIALVAIQFFHPKKNRSDAAPVDGIAVAYPTPDSVQQVLAVACNDCHSGNTRYPWYTKSGKTVCRSTAIPGYTKTPS